MKSAKVWCAILAVSAALGARAEKTINVPGDYADVAAAVAAAEDGDTVRIGVGEFVADDVAITNEILVVGAGADKTGVRPTKKSNALCRVFRLNHPKAILANLCVSNGIAYASSDDASGKFAGGGVRVEVGTLTGCRIVNCNVTRKTLGGGVAIVGAEAVVTNCVIEACMLSDHQPKGGGVFMNNGLLVDCSLARCGMRSVNGNYYAGGGVYATGGRIVRTQIVGSECFNGDNDTCFKGAGVYVAGAVSIEG